MLRGDFCYGDSHPYEANKLLEFADDLQDGQTVLDLATGTGLVAIAVAEQIAFTGFLYLS